MAVLIAAHWRFNNRGTVTHEEATSAPMSTTSMFLIRLANWLGTTKGRNTMAEMAMYPVSKCKATVSAMNSTARKA